MKTSTSGRGKGLLISNITFADPSLSSSEETEVMLDDIKKLFMKLKFKMRVAVNVTAEVSINDV